MVLMCFIGICISGIGISIQFKNYYSGRINGKKRGGQEIFWNSS